MTNSPEVGAGLEASDCVLTGVGAVESGLRSRIGLLFCAEAAIAKAKPQTTNRLLIRRANAGNFTVRQ